MQHLGGADAVQDLAAVFGVPALADLGREGLAGAVAGCGGGDHGSRMPTPLASGGERVRDVGREFDRAAVAGSISHHPQGLSRYHLVITYFMPLRTFIP